MSVVTTETRQRAARIGGADRILGEREVTDFVAEQLAGIDADGRSVCVLVPDGTRNCPLPLLIGAVHRALHGRASRLTVLIALGTHGAMSEDALAAHLGYTGRDLGDVYPGTAVRNHEWWKPETFVNLGTIPSARIEELSEGRMRGDVEVLLNRAVADHDIAVVVGPVLPHEVVGMSGGNKYFSFGDCVSSWESAAEISAATHVVYLDAPVRRVLRGAGTYDPATREERLRVDVTLATGIPESVCHGVNLGYRDPATIDVADFTADPGTLVVPRAGEVLFRLR